MSNMIQAARAQVAELTQAAYERAAAAGVLTGGAEVKATVEIPKDTAHGDYASSFAMAGAKALHMAPRAIAQAIVDHMDLTGSYSSPPTPPAPCTWATPVAAYWGTPWPTC